MNQLTDGDATAFRHRTLNARKGQACLNMGISTGAEEVPAVASPGSGGSRTNPFKWRWETPLKFEVRSGNMEGYYFRTSS